VTASSCDRPERLGRDRCSRRSWAETRLGDRAVSVRRCSCPTSTRTRRDRRSKRCGSRVRRLDYIRVGQSRCRRAYVAASLKGPEQAEAAGVRPVGAEPAEPGPHAQAGGTYPAGRAHSLDVETLPPERTPEQFRLCGSHPHDRWSYAWSPTSSPGGDQSRPRVWSRALSRTRRTRSMPRSGRPHGDHRKLTTERRTLIVCRVDQSTTRSASTGRSVQPTG